MSGQPQRTLKIVMAVANNSYPADSRVLNEAETLVAAGHELTVIAPRAPKQPAQESIKGVRVMRYPAPREGRGAIGYIWEFLYVTVATFIVLMRVWRQYGLDVIHVHNPPDTLFMTALIPKLFGKKLVYDHHDLAPELYLTKFEREDGLIYRALLLLEYLTCKMANRLIVVNDSYLCSDVERNKVPPPHITIVRNAPPLHTSDGIEANQELRQRASVIAGYLGHIAHQDGVDHMIKALHHVQADFGYDDWYAVIIGPSENIDSLTQLAEDLGIRKKLWFTGFKPDKEWRSLLAAADICFVPDPANPLNEKSTFIKLMDYMSLGKAVVAYDLKENHVSGGDAALYARASDPRDLAQQFMRLVENPAMRQRMGRLGQQRMQEALAWEYSAEKLLKFYQSDFFYPNHHE